MKRFIGLLLVVSLFFSSVIHAQVVENEISYDVEINNFYVTKDSNPQKLFLTGGPVSYVAEIENKSNASIKPEGTLTIRNFFNDSVEELPFSATISEDEIFVYTKHLEQDSLFGKYTAELDFSYSSGEEVESIETTFWVLPWWTILVSMFGLIILGWGVARLRRSYHSRIITKYSEE